MRWGRARRLSAVAGLVATLAALAGCSVAAPTSEPTAAPGSPAPTRASPVPSAAAPDASPGVSPGASSQPAANPGASDPARPVPIRAIPGVPGVAFASVPEPGRLVIETELPGEAPRVLAELPVNPDVPPAYITAVVSPDARWIGVVTTVDGTSGELALYSASGEQVWHADRQFGLFVWAADSSAVAVDFIDGTGVLLDLAGGGDPRVVPVAFEPPPPAQPSPAPYTGLHQPMGFSRDGRWLYAARSMGEPPFAEIASRIDRTTGAVTAVTGTGDGGAALDRAGHLIRTPEQFGPDGSIATITRDLPGHAVDVYAPGAASPTRIPFEATSVNDVVWDGSDRVIVLDMVLADPSAPVWEIDSRMRLIGIEPATGRTSRLLDLDVGPYAPALISCREGFALLRWFPGPKGRELEWVLAHLDSGELTGFESNGSFAGWLAAR